ncbi:PTS sugar transporter subunit IIB [Trichococcus paludicola]|uniref:PTS sugar transporter subunit IIB n=1 Tax=Trichococcus paludicola TaxID=2052942 RepID=UPI000D39CFD1|nr:PTS sugar transporter subunit IIB [Trichococcus paludicola]
MTKSILLVCSGGFSTSMLVERMKKVAREKNLDVVIEATAESNVDIMVDNVDAILLGPQMAHAEQDLKKMYAIPICTIDMRDYGMMNGEKVLNTALELIRQSN